MKIFCGIDYQTEKQIIEKINPIVQSNIVLSKYFKGVISIISTATIKIFLVYGNPKRLRTAELSNWTGKAVAGPRSDFDGIMEREEINKTGIYLLTGNDPESGKPALYIGEAERIRDRLKYHLEKDFWNNLVFFISKDENLTKAHIRYLEGKLIGKAKLNNRIIVKNDQSSGARLPESDREDMEVFLEKIHQLLPVLGIDLLVTTTDKKKSESKKEILFCEIKGLKAIGQRTPDGFVVFKDSQAVLTERSSAKNYPWPMNMRKRLKEEGTLLEKDDHLIFAKDEEFSSPSAAAAVIHGGHANGLIAWKDKQGKTLKEKEVN